MMDARLCAFCRLAARYDRRFDMCLRTCTFCVLLAHDIGGAVWLAGYCALVLILHCPYGGDIRVGMENGRHQVGQICLVMMLCSLLVSNCLVTPSHMCSVCNRAAVLFAG